jgi:hypothetical protein
VVVFVDGRLVVTGAVVVVETVVVVALVVLVVASRVLVVRLLEVVEASDDLVVGRPVTGEDVGAQATTARTATSAPTPFVTDRLKPTNRI